MGYYASGEGSATLKDNTSISKLTEVLHGLPNSEIEFQIDQNRLSFWENEDSWHEEDTLEFLKALAPFIVEGSADYSGDEDITWGYKFYPELEAWAEINPEKDYGLEDLPDEDLVSELTKRGYQIIR